MSIQSSILQQPKRQYTQPNLDKAIQFRQNITVQSVTIPTNSASFSLFDIVGQDSAQ